MHPGVLALFVLAQGCVSGEPRPPAPGVAAPPDPAVPDPAPPVVRARPALEPAPANVAPAPPPPALGDYDTLFDPAILQEIRLTIAPEDIDALDAHGRTWVPARFEHAGNVLEVGVRLKGSTTYQDFSGKPAFRVKFNEMVPRQKYATLKRLALNNLTSDPAQGREVAALYAWGAAGMVVPRAALATVYVNDEYFGLYAAVEGMDGEFLERRYVDAGGVFWEANNDADLTPSGIAHFDLNSGADPERATLAHAAAVLDDTATDLLGPAATVIDVDQYLDFLAWAAATGWSDGYPSHLNDYFLYADPADGGRFDFAPWGLDEAWSDTWRFDYGGSVLGWRCANDPACGDVLRVHTAAVLATYETLDVGGFAEALFQLSDEAMADDPRAGFDIGAVRAARAGLVDAMAGWPAKVREEMGL